MRVVTHGEIENSIEYVGMTMESQDKINDFMARLTEQQAALQVYVFTYLETAVTNDDDADGLVYLFCVIWHAMSGAANGQLAPVDPVAIEENEKKLIELLDYAEGEDDQRWTEMITTWLGAYNQRPLLEFLLDALMGDDNPYGFSSENMGLLFIVLKVVIDCLDEAA